MSSDRRFVRLLSGAAIAAAGLALAAPASARPASTPESLTILTSGVVHVTTTSGRHLSLSVRATRFAKNAGGSNADRPSTVAVSLRGNSGHETHTWSFTVAPGSFTDTSGGNGTLKTAGQLAPYGRLSLVISPVSRLTTQVCDNANGNQIHLVALKGTLKFRSHSPGTESWGAVAQRSVSFAHGRLSAGHGPDVEEACAAIPCQAGLSWTASHANIDINGTDVAAKGNKPVSHLEANRSIRLSTPAHATRIDTVIVKSPAPRLTSAGGATVTAHSAGGIATGSARLTSTRRSGYRQNCSTGQLVGKQWSATYDAAIRPLTLHEQVFGALRISADKNATFRKVHIS
ncbi:MAG TPA: hypothetical protein VHV79_02625 [Mycobacteriales bacterium]|jgi:hypothetical protein|nr:hypothetical protein [Mycobacteriales bacterium]